MSAIIALLRSVNLARHNRIGMHELRTLCGALGLKDIETFIQSGNIVFTTSEKNLRGLAARMSDAIAGEFGFRPEVILRTVDEMRKIVARNPFADRPDLEPRKLLVGFLADKPSKDSLDRLLELKISPEEVRTSGKELYVYYANGLARPNLSWVLIERTLQTRATGRNWNTVLKLLEMAQSPG
jgi:uncharacterized protein (DUF1697 family)